MPEITRERIVYRGDRDDDSDDGRSTFSHRDRDRDSTSGGYRTVQRYRVTPSRVEPVEDDRRASRTTLEVGRHGSRLEIDRTSDRFEVPPRPRSAIDIRPRSTIVERYVEREPLREPFREPSERTRTVVYERDRREPDRPWERDDRPWERERDVRETDVRIEKRVTTERREEPRREEPYELERYQRETEYYDRPEPPPPIVIRQRAPEAQQIIVQEAPAPPPIFLPQPPREEAFQVIRRREEVVQEAPREPRRAEDEYYYRRDVRVEGPRRSNEDVALGAGAVALAAPLAVAAYTRREREIRPRDSVSSDGYSDEDMVVRRRIIKKERSRSRSPHHKRHLAEGALAGAGAAALLANHRDKQGSGPEHRGRQVVGGAALGALGAEVLTRARSRYRESQDDRSRSRSSSRHSHRKIKTALGLAAAGLAAAAAAKYVSNRKKDNVEQLGRGRSRTRSVSRRRYSDDDDYDGRSRSRHADPKHRASTIAKAGVATAAVAGVVEHFRSKSRRRSGERSKSRIRTGAEIAASGLAGAAVAGLYENRKAKEDREVEEVEIRRERRRSRSRARSVGAYSDPGVDPELGMVQYGTEPVYTQTTQTNYYDPALAAGTGAAYGAAREHRSRNGRRRHSSGSSSERVTQRVTQRSRSRSRSRVRDIAGAAAGTAAAAIGINQYKKRKEKKEAEREKERRRYEEEESPAENYYERHYHDEDYSPSPPHVSGGSYYPENNQFPPPPVATGFTQQPMNTQIPEAAAPIPPYNPADYVGHAAHAHGVDPYGYPPEHVSEARSRSRPSRSSPVVAAGAAEAVASGALPYFPPPPTAPLEDEHVPSLEPDHSRESHHDEIAEEAPRITSPISPSSTATPSPILSPTNPSSKSVNFAPLSPQSSRRLAKIHKNAPHTHVPYDPSNPTTLPPSTSNYNKQFSDEAPDEEETDHVYSSNAQVAEEGADVAIQTPPRTVHTTSLNTAVATTTLLAPHLQVLPPTSKCSQTDSTLMAALSTATETHSEGVEEVEGRLVMMGSRKWCSASRAISGT